MDRFLDYIKDNFPVDLEISENNDRIVHRETDTIIIEQVNNRIIFHLLDMNNDGNFRDLYQKLKRISIPCDFDFTKLITRGYKISLYGIVSELLDINRNNTEEIKITSHKRRLIFRNNIIELGLETFEELHQTAEDINKRGKSARNSLMNYLININTERFKGTLKKNKTYYNKGDFAFQTHKLNIDSKTKKDFERFLDNSDIESLQKLSEKMIKLEVFETDFIKGLDEYFIKQKLQEIISLGREILKLKSEDIKTNKAKEISKKLKENGEIKQLESFWQVYFEKYLLHLIFSYRELIPKVKFNIDNEDKYPDFIGINHYWGVDIIEIKHHLLPVLRYDSSHKNYAFSSYLSNAIIQSMNYMDALIQQKMKETQFRKISDELNNSILNKNIHRPTAIIIISSKDKLIKKNGKISEEELKKIDRDFTKLRNSLNNIKILTFDEILDMADNYQSNIFNQK